MEDVKINGHTVYKEVFPGGMVKYYASCMSKDRAWNTPEEAADWLQVLNARAMVEYCECKKIVKDFRKENEPETQVGHDAEWKDYKSYE